MRNYKLVACDTDSIKFQKEDGSPMSSNEQKEILEYLNSLTPELIKLEEDGYYDTMVVIKTKNYITVKGDKLTIMGSALKATNKEPALKNMITDIIDCLIKKEDVLEVYNRYAKRIKHIEDISEWCSKKTVTKAVLSPSRTNEQRVLDAIGTKHVSEGDKIKVFFETKEKLTLLENFNGVYDKNKLYEKAYKTVKIFENVLDIDKIPNYKLKKFKELEAGL